MAKKKTLSEEDLKNIKILQENNRMLEKTKEEAKIRGKQKSVERIEIAQEEVINHIKSIDKDAKLFPDDYEGMIDNDKLVDTAFDNILSVQDAVEETIYDKIENSKKMEKIDISPISSTETTSEEFVSSQLYDTDMSDVDNDVQYDIISLPSNGQCYKSKTARVPVGYLTAYDENFLTSPNLYKDGIVIDFLLKQKVLNSKINVDDLVSGDADAITLFLRATSYGVDFPIVVRDPESGNEIETTVDLSTLKSKEFTLEGDENGWFDFELPMSHDKIKFRYLTRKDNKNLAVLAQLDSEGYKPTKMNDVIKTLNTFLKSDRVLDTKEKQEMLDNIQKLKDWQKKLANRNSTPYTRMITNKLEMHIMAVNGETDRAYIAKYVRNMGARDALMLRRYILANEPGIDFEITIDRPESMGGGSFKTFLEWDDAIFVNIPEL